MVPSTARPRPLDTLWQAGTLVWVVLAGEALALLLTLAPGATDEPLAYFGMASFAIQWVFVTTLGLLYLARRWLADASPVAVVRIALGALLLSTWLVCALAWWTLRDLGLMPPGGWPGFALRMTAIALTVGLLGLAAFRAQWRARQLALRAKQAELDALQARIRPHFLFNALNTGIALVHARPEATERLLLDLSDLFRAAISGREQVPLAEELSLTRRYLEIESLRFGERLEVRWEVPEEDEVPAVAIPPLSIQPLVENAIKHGIEPSRVGGLVSIGLRRLDGAIAIDVRNPLPADGSTPSTGHGIGLNAVRSRIQVFTHGEGGVETRVVDGEHIATLVLPVRL
ncbi:MAG TPA: histidine kinase [Luteimonas sp.]|nr:histidine kinase [Luteimonas sp.]HRO26572.1 histidine kinase [Luteimonas sp.]HRP72569.1 histidine kinase [Luteimonas sp.]